MLQRIGAHGGIGGVAQGQEFFQRHIPYVFIQAEYTPGIVIVAYDGHLVLCEAHVHFRVIRSQGKGMMDGSQGLFRITVRARPVRNDFHKYFPPNQILAMLLRCKASVSLSGKLTVMPSAPISIALRIHSAFATFQTRTEKPLA
ncbi:hypothetical protein SDC9_212889 [bioreactor metagenome]|uniref:Uncharacterized protein n=1 Tax=bioreactor metagenome TaxID=1076179 RepID=A0A645JQ02_9ZZZZ